MLITWQWFFLLFENRIHPGCRIRKNHYYKTAEYLALKAIKLDEKDADAH